MNIKIDIEEIINVFISYNKDSYSNINMEFEDMNNDLIEFKYLSITDLLKIKQTIEEWFNENE